MDNSLNAKQQIVERVKQSTNILVTVNSNPSVDALSAALAFTLMLNKLDKHATAVFSGAVPPAIKFLEPDKTFENKVDSLRDFIIALDKEKADRLRYKVENDVVKIFITPYRTSISEKDLHFSQGDFNVDLIIALGVERREELDKAIIAHGRILHDATVMTINAGNQKSSLGIVDWQEPTASSLCEMLLALCEALQAGLLDQQLSTALLTGIVAATERFSNQLTTPRVMTMAAQLMAAGANQQLIATNLRSISTSIQPPMISGGPSTKIDTSTTKDGTANGEMHIRHEDEQEQKQPAPQQATPPAAPTEPEIPITQPQAAAFNDLKQALETATNEQQAPAKQKFQKPQKQQRPPKKKEDTSYMTEKPSWMGRTIQPPSMGGTLNATAEEALENRLKEEADERNRTLLTHNEAAEEMSEAPAELTVEPPKPTPAEVAPAPVAPAEEPAPAVEPAPEPQAPPAEEPAPMSAEQPQTETAPAEEPAIQPAPAPAPEPPALPPMPDLPQSEPSLEELEHAAKAHAAEAEATAPVPEVPAPTMPAAPAPVPDVDAARQAVNDALESAPESPVVEPAESIGARDFTPIAPEPQAVPAAPTSLPAPQPAPLQPSVADMNPQTAAQPSGLPLPPLPDFSTLPPLPPQPPVPDTQLPPLPQQQPQLPPLPQAPPVAEPPVNDPHQFKIPGA